MNLAIEYVLRSGEIKQNLRVPFSLFLKRHNSNDKLVVTVHRAFDDSLAIKHWLISECTIDIPVPQFLEYASPAEDLFSSPHIVVPCHSPVWYLEDPFEVVYQHSDEPHASADAAIYNSHIDQCLNSRKHRLSRIAWLWSVFGKTYQVRESGFVSFDHTRHHIRFLKKHHPKLVSHWIRWRRYMLDFDQDESNVAAELAYQQEYIQLCKEEGREPALPKPKKKGFWLNYEFNPFPAFNPNDLFV